MRAYVATDHAVMAQWYRAHGLTAPPAEMLPPTGLIAEGLAAGFLYRTDGALCLIDGMISNPSAPLLARARAMHRIVDALLATACAAGLHRVLGFCASSGMARLARTRGFALAGHYTLMMGEV